MRCSFGSVAGVDGDETRFPSGAESAGVVMIHNDASRENHDAVAFRKSDRQFAPTNQIAADGVAPTHVAPAVAEGIELEEQMILAFEIYKAVRIVGPVAGGGKMELRAERFLISSGLAEKCEGCTEESGSQSRRQDPSLAAGRLVRHPPWRNVRPSF